MVPENKAGDPLNNNQALSAPRPREDARGYTSDANDRTPAAPPQSSRRPGRATLPPAACGEIALPSLASRGGKGGHGSRECCVATTRPTASCNLRDGG